MKKFHYLGHSIAYCMAWFSRIALAARGYAWWSSFIVIVCVFCKSIGSLYCMTLDDKQFG